jgi:two-component system chemotaxis response regulator CheB
MTEEARISKPSDRLIVIGASAGGVEALQVLLSGLPAHMKNAIAVVMHLPEFSDIQFSKIFDPGPNYQIREARDKMPIDEMTITFSPPGYHLLIEKNRTFSLSQDEPVHFSRPSIDVFFESAAQVYQKKLTGILLTGANEDGAHGLWTVHQFGGKTIVQDPATAQIPIMPKAALSLFNPDFILSLPQIRTLLMSEFAKEAEWKT